MAYYSRVFGLHIEAVDIFVVSFLDVVTATLAELDSRSTWRAFLFLSRVEREPGAKISLDQRESENRASWCNVLVDDTSQSVVGPVSYVKFWAIFITLLTGRNTLICPSGAERQNVVALTTIESRVR